MQNLSQIMYMFDWFKSTIGTKKTIINAGFHTFYIELYMAELNNLYNLGSSSDNKFQVYHA